MAGYRLFLLKHGHIYSSGAFDALDDGAAVAIAEGRLGVEAAELWNGSRVVRKFEASVAVSTAQGREEAATLSLEITPPTSPPPGIVQRALEVAREGDCRTITQVSERLRREGYTHIASNLSGGGLRKQLRGIMKAER